MRDRVSGEVEAEGAVEERSRTELKLRAPSALPPSNLVFIVVAASGCKAISPAGESEGCPLRKLLSNSRAEQRGSDA